ncbi:fatty acid desaturase family protein [Cecembia rubra]|uniref:fatty acid desaturase family protein n=1 Tax=Cecembia rubra TaxID=1485585 RepID=UPI0027144D7A|nr:acyl-CoA desaturase [Cecembia rubra]
MRPPRFQAASSFHEDLKGRIKNYFLEKNLKTTGNFSLYFKAIVMVLAFIGIYVHLVFFTPIWPFAILESIILGALTAGIGFNVMHDGAHGSFSRKGWVNELAGISINFLGANVHMWKTKHNVAHHSFTNVDDHDDDLNAGAFLRLGPNQKRYKVHRFQHRYFIFIYAILYFYWVFFTDYKKYVTKKVAETPIKKMDLKEHVSFWGFKAVHLFLFIILPIYMVGFLPWLVGFLIFGLATGVIMSVVFQLAHVLEETSFPTPDKATNKLEDDWAIHQLKTTANFATKNKVLSWLIGGLNFQIEHHLFPNISHIHYPAISKIIKDTCREYGIPYIEHPKMRLAIASHVNHLRHLGRG